MATEIKSRRGTAAQHDDSTGFTGAEGELTVDTTNDTVRVHDGSTKGGHRLAKYTEVQASNELSEMLDVNLTSPADGSLLKYDNASSKWIDSSKLTETSSGIDVTGDVAATTVTVGDGTSTDLKLYKDGSNNCFIEQRGSGGLDVSGIYGKLSNESNQELISWDTDNAALSWRGASGAGLKLTTTETGINVTGTVAASDGLTADYIDLTGGESTTTTGTIACKQIVLNDPTSTNDGNDGTDLARIYTEEGFGNQSKLVIHSADDGNDQIVLRTDNDVDTLIADSHGIDVTGTVICDGVSLEAGDKLIFGAEANSSLQIYEDDDGGKSRIAQYGGGDLWIQGENISLRNDDAETLIGTGHTQAFMYWQGDTGTKGERLRTTDSGIDVTGTVTADDQIIITSNDSQVAAQPTLTLRSNETASTDNQLAEITFQGHNNQQVDQTYAYMRAESPVITDDQEEGKLKFFIRKTGNAYANALTVDSSGIYVTGKTRSGSFETRDSINYNLLTRDDDTSAALYVQNKTTTGKIASFRKGSAEPNNGTEVLGVTKDGIDVTGAVTADAVSLGDADQIQIGDKVGGDLKIYHSGGHSFIEDVGTGNLVIRGQHVEIKDSSNKQKVYVADGASGAVQLYYGHDTSAKLTTTAAGIDVAGTVTCDEALTISSDGTGADAKPDIWLFNNASAAVDERLGQITWYGKNDVAPEQETVNYAFQEVKTTNVGDGTEQAEMQFHIRNGASHVEVLTLDSSGIDVTGTVEADAFSGTGTTAITDFITDVSTSNNDTTVPTTAAVKSYVDNNDGDTTYTGGTGLTLNGTTFNVDAAQTQITSVGTLSSLTTGATTVNGSLSVNSTTSDTSYSPEIVLERNGGAAAGDDGDKLGVITFKGDNTSGTQSVYAQVGARIVDDGVDNANTKGEIRISCGYNANLVSLEDPSLRINHLGTWVNESTIDGTPVGASFYNVSKGTTSGIKYWANQSSGYAIEVKSVTPTADRDITFPDVSGAIVVAGVAGGSMNGGGGLGTAQTAWSPEQFATNANTDYYHYTPSGTDVDLVVAVPYAGIDISGFGSKFIFRNISAEAGSKITIDLDGFTSAISQGATQYYSINKYDGSAPTLITSAAANLVVSTGGVIELSPIANGVWNITGVGFA